MEDEIDLAHIFHLFFSSRSLITHDSAGEIFLHASEFIRLALSAAPVNRWTTRALINEDQMRHR